MATIEPIEHFDLPKVQRGVQEVPAVSNPPAITYRPQHMITQEDIENGDAQYWRTCWITGVRWFKIVNRGDDQNA